MAKRFLCLLLTLILTLSLMPLAASAEGDPWMQFYVSPTGSDEADGTEAAPFKTIPRAQEEVRKYNQSMKGDIVVNLMPGHYFLEDRLEFGIADSGSNGYDVRWRGTDPDNLPVISGAKQVTGTWEEGEDGIWHIQAENLDFARSLFVNDRQATRAKGSRKIYGGKQYLGDTIYHRHYQEKDPEA
ncbi:MAG: hypothetical protein E7418_05535, partial [Ruminococcaceae bacterium]|nr:hypothetical protein [Oscillospiraceae bacterium]